MKEEELRGWWEIRRARLSRKTILKREMKSLDELRKARDEEVSPICSAGMTRSDLDKGNVPSHKDRVRRS